MKGCNPRSLGVYFAVGPDHLLRRAITTGLGTNCRSDASSASGVICLSSEEEMCENSAALIRNTVSISGFSLRLARVIVNSVSMSIRLLTPRNRTRAPCCLTNSTDSPEKRATSTLWICATESSTRETRSSSENRGCLSGLMPTPTMMRSKIFDALVMTSKCPSVIGSKEPV